MTHLPGTSHVAKLAIGFAYGSQQLENILYVKDPSDAIFANPSGFLASVQTSVVSALIPHMHTNITFNQLGFEDVRTVPFGGLVVPVTPAVPGAISTTAALPGDVCIAVKKNTGNIGRSGRGRWYWPVTDIGDLSGGNFVATAYANAVAAALVTLQGDIEAYLAGIEVGINSYFLNKIMRSAGDFQQVTSWTLSDYVVDSQRKRLPGRGR